MKKTKDIKEKINVLKHKVYFGFNKRLIANIILFLIFFVFCLLFATNTIEREKLDPINYTENGKVEYKVYLNKNDYYAEEYLGMDKAYIANLINYIDADFSYVFKIDKNTNMSFDYKIIGELVIENNSGEKRYFEKEYTILDTKTKNINNSDSIVINENVKIDYNSYNNLANNFRSDYGVDTNSYLNVYLEVESSTDESLNYKINENNKINLKIPLSEKAIEINFNSSKQNTTKQVIPVGSIIFNLKSLIMEIVLFICACVFFVKIIKLLTTLMKTQTQYDKYVNKLLKDYDRLIVETHTITNMDNCNIIGVNNFNELLDVRDNLKVPIIYLNIVKHQKGIFYIKNNNDVYMLNVKNIDSKEKKQNN